MYAEEIARFRLQNIDSHSLSASPTQANRVNGLEKEGGFTIALCPKFGQRRTANRPIPPA